MPPSGERPSTRPGGEGIAPAQEPPIFGGMSHHDALPASIPAELHEDLTRAIAAALAAGAVIARMPVGAIREKSGPRDIVTAVDGAAERAAIEALSLRPGESLCAEESAPGPVAMGRTWTIDPLDGTLNFAHGLPFYGPAVALCLDGEPVVAATFDPTRGDLFIAAKGGGAYLLRNGSVPVRLAPSGHAASRGLWYAGLWNGGDALTGEKILAAGHTIRSFGASAIGLAMVAAGRMEAYVQAGHLWPWDVTGGVLLCREAGMTVRHTDLRAPDGVIRIVATDPELDALGDEIAADLGIR
jgi:myo-inositol-1(or 4)-monophosphatase